MPESNSSTEPRHKVGRLGRPHGLDGFLGLYVDQADVVYFEPPATVLISGRDYSVRDLRRVDRGYQVRFEGVGSREEAEALRGRDIEVTERRALGLDEYWPEDLVGLELKDAAGHVAGVVVGLVTGGAQDRLVVEVGPQVYEIPFVRDLVPVVDLDAGFVQIVDLPGLIEQSPRE